MTDTIQRLADIWKEVSRPFLIYGDKALYFSDLSEKSVPHLDEVQAGDVVALIGDFEPLSIFTLLKIMDKGAIVMPLTRETRQQHDYFFDSAGADTIIERGVLTKRHAPDKHKLVKDLREKRHGGLILFSTGTTGRPKAILHDLTLFLKRFETPRPTLRTLNFLLFDHIGGLNTLFHTLFNRGIAIAPTSRTVESVLDTCERHQVEVLPTTPTFLRLILMSGAVPDRVPPCLKIITYGTERMDQPTLDELCRLLPNIDFRQTFGMSELGIVRVKSAARNSLYMKIGGEGVETKVVDRVLHIRSRTAMLGYLNAPSPFDDEGWYDTGDVVDEGDGYYKITGRVGDVINVGGQKFMAAEVERVALLFPEVSLAKAFAKNNPITGQHVEMTVQMRNKAAEKALKSYLNENLPVHMRPRRLHFQEVVVGHRFKKA